MDTGFLLLLPAFSLLKLPFCRVTDDCRYGDERASCKNAGGNRSLKLIINKINNLEWKTTVTVLVIAGDERHYKSKVNTVRWWRGFHQLRGGPHHCHESGSDPPSTRTRPVLPLWRCPTPYPCFQQLQERATRGRSSEFTLIEVACGKTWG